MECTCCDIKQTQRTIEEKEELIKHLNRINGQINGIKNMVEESRYCDDILMQISAANNSLRNLGLTLLDHHIKTCVKTSLENNDDTVLDEMMQNFRRFIR